MRTSAAELDLMAQLAGFVLESRHADWSGSEFAAESSSHVSVYRLPDQPLLVSHHIARAGYGLITRSQRLWR
jgi:hypothetical protein